MESNTDSNDSSMMDCKENRSNNGTPASNSSLKDSNCKDALAPSATDNQEESEDNNDEDSSDDDSMSDDGLSDYGEPYIHHSSYDIVSLSINKVVTETHCNHLEFSNRTPTSTKHPPKRSPPSSTGPPPP